MPEVEKLKAEITKLERLTHLAIDIERIKARIDKLAQLKEGLRKFDTKLLALIEEARKDPNSFF